MKFEIVIQEAHGAEQYQDSEGKYKYARIIDPEGREAPSAVENYKRAREAMNAWLRERAARKAAEKALKEFFQ